MDSIENNREAIMKICRSNLGEYARQCSAIIRKICKKLVVVLLKFENPMPHGITYLLATLFVFTMTGFAPAPAPTPIELTIGVSNQGRPITAVRFGDGPHKLVVVGDTHGGPEANTYVLTNQLIEYFRANPDAVPASVRLYLIPTLNPDGLANGSRFNANNIDLNRNMDTTLDTCAENDWNTVVQGAYGLISETGGPYADSEVESRIIRSFLLDANGAIFIHSNAGLVFPASCEHAPSILMGQIYAEGASYVYSRYWPKYNITGGMHDWAGSLGISAITPELITGDQPEFDQNLAGLQAVLASAEDIMPPPQERSEAGIVMPELLWRYWQAHGGMARFGPPLEPASETGGVTRQRFTNTVLELRLDQADTAGLVQPAPLGRNTLLAPIPPTSNDGSGRYFAETRHSLRGAFLDHWQRVDGGQLYGPPLSEEITITAADGQRRTGQIFERAILARYDDGSIRAEPLGWAELVRGHLNAPQQPFQVR